MTTTVAERLAAHGQWGEAAALLGGSLHYKREARTAARYRAHVDRSYGEAHRRGWTLPIALDLADVYTRELGSRSRAEAWSYALGEVTDRRHKFGRI
jgi:hypothetical protein